MPWRGLAFGAGAVLAATTALAFTASIRLGVVMLFFDGFVVFNVVTAWGIIEGFRPGSKR